MSSSAVRGPSDAAAARASSGRARARAARGRRGTRPAPRAQAAQQQVLGRRADGHHRPDSPVRGRGRDRAGSRPCSSRAARRPARARASGRTSPARRRRRSGRTRPRSAPWPRASKASAASPSVAAARAKSKWLSFAEPAPCRITTPAVRLASGRNSAYASPSCVAELGRARDGVLHNRCVIISAAPWRPTARLAGLPARLPAERARPARGRRLRRDRARARVRHARLRLRRGRHPRPRARVHGGVRARAPSTSRWSTRARRSRARPPTGCSREEGLSVRRGVAAASCTWR